MSMTGHTNPTSSTGSFPYNSLSRNTREKVSSKSCTRERVSSNPSTRERVSSNASTRERVSSNPSTRERVSSINGHFNNNREEIWLGCSSITG